MPMVADTHVHLYDCYDIGVFLRSAFSNLGGYSDNSLKGIFHFQIQNKIPLQNTLQRDENMWV